MWEKQKSKLELHRKERERQTRGSDISGRSECERQIVQNVGRNVRTGYHDVESNHLYQNT